MKSIFHNFIQLSVMSSFMNKKGILCRTKFLTNITNIPRTVRMFCFYVIFHSLFCFCLIITNGAVIQTRF